MRNFFTATLLLLVIILFFQNLSKSTVNLLFWQTEFSIGFWILSAFLSGLLSGFLLGYFRKGKKAEEPKSEIGLSEDEEYLQP